MQEADVEFSRLFPVDKLRNHEMDERIEANEEELEALAKRMGVVALKNLNAKLRLQRIHSGEMVEVKGHFKATVVQDCVVTLEPFEALVEEDFTFKELMQRVATYTGRNTIPLSLPIWFAKLLAIGTKPFPLSIRPITYDQVLLLKNDNVVSAAAINDKRTLQGLGIAHPKRIDEVVPHYLAKFRRRG